jgi:hypothetical protein
MAKPATESKADPPNAKKPYDARGCASLFGYAAKVHERSGGICQLCGCFDGPDADFDSWRQLSVEHIIGRKHGGDRSDIKKGVKRRIFSPPLPSERTAEVIDLIDAMNTVSACSFCNSMTSRMTAKLNLGRIIEETPGGDAELLQAVEAATQAELALKREDVGRKLESIRRVFKADVMPGLARVRNVRPKAKLASKSVRARPVKAIKDAVG